MRKSTEIIQDKNNVLTSAVKGKNDLEISALASMGYQGLILEVLLDIRDILACEHSYDKPINHKH